MSGALLMGNFCITCTLSEDVTVNGDLKSVVHQFTELGGVGVNIRLWSAFTCD